MLDPFEAKATPLVPEVAGQIGGTLCHYRRCAVHAQETRQHLAACAVASADDLANGELPITSQMPVAEAAIDQEQFASLGAFVQGIEDHR